MAGSVAQSLGIVYIIWGGVRLNVEGKSSSFSMGGLVSKPVIAGSQVSQAQEYMAPKIKASFPLLAGMSIAALKGCNNTEMQVACDSGQTYTVPGAFLTADLTVKGGSGNNVSAEWSGDMASEVIS